MYNNSNSGNIKGSGIDNYAVAGSSVQSQTEVVHAATVLDNAISRAAARMGELTQRLIPIIQNRPAEVTGTNPSKLERQIYSPIGRGLIENAYRVEDIERQINDLLDNLAI